MITFKTILDLWKNGYKLEVQRILDEICEVDSLEPDSIPTPKVKK